MIQVLYIYHLDPEDINAQSGRPHGILKEMRARGFTVDVVVVDDRVYRAIYYFFRACRLLRVYKGTPLRASLLARYAAYKATKCLSKKKYDLIFSPTTLWYRYLKTSTKKVACVDTFVPGFFQYYDLDPSDYEKDHESERCAVKNTNAFFVPTRWAAAQLKELSDAPAEVYVWPFGANWPAEPSAAEVAENIQCRLGGGLVRIVTISSDWERKGGDLIKELVEAIALAVPEKKVELVVIGFGAPQGIDFRNVQVTIVGRLNKNQKEQLEKFQEIMASSHFCCIPSKGEAFGMALCEALAYGVPIIGSKNGGIEEVVEEGRNGFYLQSSADVKKVTERIQQHLVDSDRYRSLALNSRISYEEKYSWKKFFDNTFAKINLGGRL